MSFILDALRKPEAARRRSEAPDLFASMPAAREPARARANWPLWLLGAVAAISLIAVLWLLAQRTPPASPEPSNADTTAETAPADDSATTAPSSAPAPVPTQAPPPTMDHPPPHVAATATPTPATPLPSPTRELPAPPPEPAVVVAPPSAALPTGSIVSLADLDPATRKLLPPLKLSMHLWNETPAQRFVILDGQRLREGDVLGELVIERITRDGAVLAWRGAQLKIELR